MGITSVIFPGDRPLARLPQYNKPPPPAPKYGTLVAPPAPRLTDWSAILEQCGYPTRVLVLDFETHFDDKYNMRRDEWSTIEYIMSDKFEVLGLAVLDSERPSESIFLQGETEVAEYLDYWGRCDPINTVVTQNARFDMAILAYKYGIYPKHHIDVLGLARHWNARAANDLDTLAKRFMLPYEKGDTKEFKEWTTHTRWKRTKSRKKGPKMPIMYPKMNFDRWAKLEEYALNDAVMEWELFKLLLPKLSDPETELYAMQHTIELFTKPQLEVDYERAESLKVEMLGEVDKALHETGHTREEISGNISFAKLMDAALDEAGDRPIEYKKLDKKNNWMYAIAKTDSTRELLVIHEDDTVRFLMAARIAIKSWPLHIKRIDRIVSQCKAAGGKLPVPLKYYGAHTGRWSGGEKINLQNLGSRGHPTVNAIRELLIAPEGYELVIADASAIEARVLAWIAQQDDLCQKFRDGEEVYCGFAEKVLGRPVVKPHGDMKAEEYEWNKWARNMVGKVGVLAGGYGMGWKKAIIIAKGEIDEPTARKLIIQYREDNDKIVQFWYDLERCFLHVARYRQPCQLRNLHFRYEDDCDVIITLPNGREIKYHDVKWEEESRGTQLRIYNPMEHKWEHIWGGHMAENVVQATSRDILWHGIESMVCQGYPTVLHIHDELISIVPEGEGKFALQNAIYGLSHAPNWAEGCPLDAEGSVTKRYGNH